MPKKLKIFLTVFIVFVITLGTSTKILFESDEILINFKILELSNKYTNFYLRFSPVKAADHYVIQIYNSKNLKVFESTTKKTENNLELSNLVNGESYSLIVFAYDKLGDYRPSENEKKFKWDEPSLDYESILLKDSNYSINILGNVKDKNVYIKIVMDDNEIINEKLTDNKFILNNKYYKGLEKELIVSLYSDNALVDEVHLFNNYNPITDISINNLVNEQVIPYNDVTVSYDGGDNASIYEIKIYKGKQCIKTSKTNKKAVVISKKLFTVGGSYKVEINAKLEDYVKSDIVSFTMSEQVQLNPVYLSNNWRYLKKGTKLVLDSNNENAKIYYTLNGENPESFGTLYTEPLIINENVTLKTVAVMEGFQNSIVKTYDINVGVKEKLKVYLSPSNQHGNLGVRSVGYTNEMDEMNDLSNYIQERLESYGVKVYRNNPAGNINLWNRDSNYYGVDFKIAVHSNASDYHDTYGIETWIDSQNSQTLSIASSIQNGLMSIYPYAGLEDANRGVKYANGALGEANDLYTPFQLLVEIAHHDYEDDAKWIMENKKLIGYNIADSILKYYQIID